MKYAENRTETRREDWSTPKELFDYLDTYFGFEVDLAADGVNTKCDMFYNLEIDFFRQPVLRNRCWCNPPYGRDHNKIWPIRLMEYPNIVVLHQASVGANWFQVFFEKSDLICFPKGRIQFEGAPAKAQFDSVLVVRLSDKSELPGCARHLEVLGPVVKKP